MKLFVDMDGVLADFDRGYFERFGIRTSKENDNVEWWRLEETPGFFRDLPPMPDFDDLWSAVQPFNPTVLTGLPRKGDEAYANKREWIDLHLGPDVPMIGCRSAEKCLHGNPGDVLIDDWEKYRHHWEQMGGIWITHTSAATSIAELHQALARIRRTQGGAA